MTMNEIRAEQNLEFLGKQEKLLMESHCDPALMKRQSSCSPVMIIIRQWKHRGNKGWKSESRTETDIVVTG